MVGLKTGMAAGFAAFVSAPSDLAASFSAAYGAEAARALRQFIDGQRVTCRERDVDRYGRIVAVFQPHRYSRVASLFDDFCTCFNDADVVFVTDIYPAGEGPIEGVDRDALVARTDAAGIAVLGLDPSAAGGASA